VSPRAHRTEQFRRDTERVGEYYVDEVGLDTALAFVAELEQAVDAVLAFPGAGSPRLAELAGLPGVRAIALGKFPYLVFYTASEDAVLLLRLAHNRRDLPSVLHEDA
jgi:toxin ParE1/3/4